MYKYAKTSTLNCINRSFILSHTYVIVVTPLFGRYIPMYRPKVGYKLICIPFNSAITSS